VSAVDTDSAVDGRENASHVKGLPRVKEPPRCTYGLGGDEHTHAGASAGVVVAADRSHKGEVSDRAMNVE